MSKSDTRRLLGAGSQIVDRPWTYVLQARRRDAEHVHNETMPWYVQRFEQGQKQPVYTTDVKDAQTFSSLVSADSYAVALDMDSPEYHHAVDIIRPGM